uniref:Uncharacterized protein n=1 Tax=Alexandrium catenella TaxID=2925 RepID=A0A7S1L243_ALECA
MELRSAFRQKVAELSVCEDPLISVGAWEAANEGSARPREVADALHQHVLQHFRYSLDGLSMKTFFVCGSDVVEQQGLTKGFPVQHDLGIVIVPRGSEDDVFMELPHHLVFMVDSLQGDAAMLSSTLVREAVKASDTSRAAQFMALATARFLLAPTAMEREEFRADFDQLGVRLPAAPELSQMRQSLKEALKNWAGPSGSISTKDLSRLLRALDPSWTGQELDALLQQAASAADGRVDSDGFVDWIFSGCLQPVVTA